VEVVFEGRLRVSYMQAHVYPNEDLGIDATDPGAPFAGQVNGLLGAALPGRLQLTTGLHTGDVGLRMIVAECPPPVGPEWEDVVEAPFRPAGYTRAGARERDKAILIRVDCGKQSIGASRL